MSHYMTALAMKQTGIKPAAKIVLYWLADHHNSETGRCFPSISTLVQECEMSKATVIRHLSELEAAGLITSFKRYRENGSQTSSEYELSMKQPVSKCDPPCLKMTPPPVSKCDPHNLGNNNLGNEQVLPLDLPDPPSKQKSRLPEGWRPDGEMTAYAKSKSLLPNEIERIADDFFAYWDDQPKSKSTKSLRGWRAAWRNRIDAIAWQFIRNRNRPGNGGGMARATTTDEIADRAARYAQSRAARGGT